jgi:hypothetical protein
MQQFIKPISDKEIDKNIAIDLCSKIESENDLLIDEAISFIKSNPNYQQFIEQRYLNFIKAHLKKTHATLSDLKKIELNPQVLNYLNSMDYEHWQFEGEYGDEAFLFLANFCGAFVASIFDFNAYQKYHLDYYKQHKDHDYDNDLFYRLKEAVGNMDVTLSIDGWYNQLLQKVCQTDLVQINFDHSDCSLIDDILYFDEFLAFLNGFMDSSDRIDWDFAQSTLPKFPSTLYLTNYNWTFICQKESFHIPEPLDENFNNTYMPIHFGTPT